jgi:predicted nucleotidyltransferase
MILPENIQEEIDSLDKKYKILNIYLSGSRSYENNSDDSDYDLILIAEQLGDARLEFKFFNGTIFIFRKSEFERKLKEHDVSALECFFLPKKFKIREKWKPILKINKKLIKEKFGIKANKSYNKAKKWLEHIKNLNELDKNDSTLINKNMYHALRILLFMCQILNEGKIVDYTEANDIKIDVENYEKIFAKLLKNIE